MAHRPASGNTCAPARGASKCQEKAADHGKQQRKGVDGYDGECVNS